MNNLIDAIINIIKQPVMKLADYTDSHNRINSTGAALEEYIKDVFAGTLGEYNQQIRNHKIAETFSYLGNQNNPPDSMLRCGDAIEVKKIESKSSFLSLNSSYPKDKLFKNSSMITSYCRETTDWGSKLSRDIIYVVGICQQQQLKTLSMVYGVDYAASASVYERIAHTIKKGVLSIPDIEFSATNELGRVNRVDPLGITYLRLRGMWGIENPVKTFNYVYQPKEKKKFNLMAVVNYQKYFSFENYSQLEDLAKVMSDLAITDIKIKNPNNPAELKEAKLITFSSD